MSMRRRDILSDPHAPQHWRTCVDPHLTASFRCGELHAVIFLPIGDRNGSSDTVAIEIPEVPDRQVVDAMRWATRHRATVLFFCNTHAQAEAIAERAASLLPRHSRVALERVAAGVCGAVS